MRHRDVRKEIKYGQSGGLDAATPGAAIVTWESAAGGTVVREVEIGVSKDPGPVLFMKLSGPQSRSDSP